MNYYDKHSDAIEELKILSSIIGRIDNATYQKQGWLFTLITGLTIAFFKDKSLIDKSQFALISIFATIAFFITDIIQRIPASRAIKRSNKVESILRRKNKNYDGPLISKSISKKENFKEYLNFYKSFRVWAPYLSIIIVIGIILFVDRNHSCR